MPNVVTTKPNRRLTQPGHPSAGRRNEYWRWLRQPLGKKWQVLHNSRLCYQDCWHTDPAQSASKGMSSHATDLGLCKIFFHYYWSSVDWLIPLWTNSQSRYTCAWTTEQVCDLQLHSQLQSITFWPVPKYTAWCTDPNCLARPWPGLFRQLDF